MIPTFEEYIKEGFLSKTYDRYRSGEKRTEDKFNKHDVNVFDFNENNAYRFLKENDIYDMFMKTYPEKLEEVYEDYIVNYCKQHGVWDLGFSLDDSAPMPDFNWSFTIPKLKDVTIFINYTDQNAEITIFCGNNKEEFDISKTKFGRLLIDQFNNIFRDVFDNHPNLLETNIKKNWEEVKELLYTFVYETCYKDMLYDIGHGYELSEIGQIELFPDEYSSKLQKYFINVDWGEKTTFGYTPKVTLGYSADVDITDTNIGKEIIKIYMDAYKEAKDKAMEEMPDEE